MPNAMVRTIGILFCLGALLEPAAWTQEPPDQPAAADDAAADQGRPGDGDAAEPATPAPAATAPFDVEAATRDYLARQTRDEKERSDRYFEGGYWLLLWGFLYGLVVPWLLLRSGLSARMRDLAARVTGVRAVHVALYAVQYLLITTVAFFPLTLYQQYFREHAYDLATQSIGPWLRDQAIGLAIGLVLLPLLLVALYAVFRRAPRSWWLWGAGVSLVFLVMILVISPVFIEPLFNTYTELDDPAVAEPILALARSSGVEVDQVFQFDASRQTTRISANVNGFLGTMRIALNDNLLARCSLPEIESVMAHEIGHYVLNHVYESTIFFFLVLVAGFAFVRATFDRAVARWGGRWGVEGIADVAGVPLLAILFGIYFFALTPVLNTFIRSNEAEADLFGLHASRQPDGFAEAALKLGAYRKLDPGPLEEWLFFDHPSGRARIYMAMQWKAEHLNDPPGD